MIQSNQYDSVKSEIQQYKPQDLSRSLIREFLIKLNLKETYETFNTEDKRPRVKMTKIELIKQLAMDKLIKANKQKDKPLLTMADVLVQYLNSKFLHRKKNNQNIYDEDNYNSNGDLNNKSYQIQDLSRNLVREFMIKENLVKTLQIFTEEDTRPREKMTRIQLIQQLSMERLIKNNKLQAIPFNTMLDVLTNYLQYKYQQRINEDTLTNISSQTNSTNISSKMFKNTESNISSNDIANSDSQYTSNQNFNDDSYVYQNNSNTQQLGNKRPSQLQKQNNTKPQLKANNFTGDNEDNIKDKENNINENKQNQIKKQYFKNTPTLQSNSENMSNYLKRPNSKNNSQNINENLNQNQNTQNYNKNIRKQEYTKEIAANSSQNNIDISSISNNQSNVNTLNNNEDFFNNQIKPIDLKENSSKFSQQNSNSIINDSNTNNQPISKKTQSQENVSSNKILEEEIVEETEQNYKNISSNENLNQSKKNIQKKAQSEQFQQKVQENIKFEQDENLNQTKNTNDKKQQQENQNNIEEIIPQSNINNKINDNNIKENKFEIEEITPQPRKNDQKQQENKFKIDEITPQPNYNENKLNQKQNNIDTKIENDNQQNLNTSDLNKNNNIKKDNENIEKQLNNNIENNQTQISQIQNTQKNEIEQIEQQKEVKVDDNQVFYGADLSTNNKPRNRFSKRGKKNNNVQSIFEQAEQQIEDKEKQEQEELKKKQEEEKLKQKQIEDQKQNQLDELDELDNMFGGNDYSEKKQKVTNTNKIWEEEEPVKKEEEKIVKKELEILDYVPLDILKPGKLSFEKPAPTIDLFKYSQIDAFSRNVQIIQSKEIQAIKKLLFASAPIKYFPNSWSQGFIFRNDDPDKFYGLLQKEGGPCGVIASVQAYYLKWLFFIAAKNQEQTKDYFSDPVLKENLLLASLADILWKCSDKQNVRLAIINTSVGQGKVAGIENCGQVSFKINNFEQLYDLMHQYKEEYLGEFSNGVATFIYSVVLTKGHEIIQSEFDMEFNGLIGEHGHCSQEGVNLLLTGHANSNVFDGDKDMDGMVLKGIKERSEFGFMTIHEHYDYVKVGDNLKTPYYPIWVLCKEYHYSVIFGKDSRCNENLAEKFDVIYYDELYNTEDRLLLTVTLQDPEKQDKLNVFGKKIEDENNKEDEDLIPMLELVMRTKWGKKIKVDWNESTVIL